MVTNNKLEEVKCPKCGEEYEVECYSADVDFSLIGDVHTMKHDCHCNICGHDWKYFRTFIEISAENLDNTREM